MCIAQHRKDCDTNDGRQIAISRYWWDKKVQGKGIGIYGTICFKGKYSDPSKLELYLDMAIRERIIIQRFLFGIESDDPAEKCLDEKCHFQMS